MRQLLIALMLVFPLAAWSQITDVTSLQNQLAKYNVVRGDFTQVRHITLFKQPLVSSGQFLLDKSNGLIWHQASPFPVNIVLTQEKLRQTFRHDPPEIITAEENPIAFYFSHIFLSVFQGDTKQLSQQFSIRFENRNGTWSLTLTPNKPPLNAVFKQISLTGEQEINALTFEEIRGDKTEITFSHQIHHPETLTHAEQAQFHF